MNNMKISSTENKDGRHQITKTALFVRFLVKICFFPISIRKGLLHFKWISLKTLTYLSFSLGAIGFKFCLYFYFFPEELYGYLEGKMLDLQKIRSSPVLHRLCACDAII